MKSTSYKIRIRATVNGVEKTPSNIAWINGSDECLVRKCYKEKDYIVIELIPDCVGDSCIEGWVNFDENCADCEPIYFKRCFCSGDTDCGPCEECVLGVCQSKCPIDFVCKNDKCIECDSTIPCPDGKICKDNKCVCAPGTFYSNQYKRCVECDSTTVFTDKCKSCVNGHILHVDCYGACDPATGICVDCVKNSDCDKNTDGRNCCDNKVCKCCAGTIWSPTLNKCVEDCKDAGCPTCQRCGPEGCEPVKCPEGFKCVDDICVPWPCTDVTCANGGDCGKDCGCLDGECVPCAILGCAAGKCENVLGCECAGNGICKGRGHCDYGYCDGFLPCLEDGCTCYENKCVDCGNFSCANGECAVQLGCKCLNGKCVDDPDGGGDGCADTFTLSPECGAECKLKASLNSGPCKCDPIKFEVKPTTANGKTIVNVEMYKGTSKYSEYTKADNIGNNEIVSGQVVVLITYTKAGSPTLTDTKVVNVASDNKVPPVEILEKPGYTMSFSVQNKGVKISNNACKDYDDEQIASYNAADILAGVTKANMSKDSTSSRIPLFVWSKNGVVIKKDFPKGSNGKYEDFIDDPALATLGDNFVVKAECGCSTTTSLSNLEFCCSNVDVPITACGSKAAIPKIDLCELIKKQGASPTVKFKLSDGTTDERVLSGANFEYDAPKDTSIEGAEFYLEAKGKKYCVRTLPVPGKVAPTPTFSPVCGDASTNTAKMTISSPNVGITSISFSPKGVTNDLTGNKTSYFFDIDKNELAKKGPLEATVTYTNGCIAKVVIPVCDPKVSGRPIFNPPTCDNLGQEGKLELTPVGFDTSKSIKYTVFKNGVLFDTFSTTPTPPVTVGGGITTKYLAPTNIPFEGDGTYTIWIEQDSKKVIEVITIETPDNVVSPNIIVGGGDCLKDEKDIQVLLGDTFKNVSVVLSYVGPDGKNYDFPIKSNDIGVATFKDMPSGTYRVTLVKDSSVLICNNEKFEVTKAGKEYTPSVTVLTGCAGTGLPLTFSADTLKLSTEAIGGTIDFSNNIFYPTPGQANYGINFYVPLSPNGGASCDIIVPGTGYTVKDNVATFKFTNIIQPITYTNLISPCVAGKTRISLKTSATASVRLISSTGGDSNFTGVNGEFALYNVPQGNYTIEISEPGKCTTTIPINIGTCGPVQGTNFEIETTSVCVNNSYTPIMMAAKIKLNTLVPTAGFITWHTINCGSSTILSSDGPYTFNTSLPNGRIYLQKSYNPSTTNYVCVKATISYGDNVESFSNIITLLPTVMGTLAIGESCVSGLPCQCDNNVLCQQNEEGFFTCGGEIIVDDCTTRDVDYVTEGYYCDTDAGCPCAADYKCVNYICQHDCGCGFFNGLRCATNGQNDPNCVGENCCEQNESCTCPGGLVPCTCTPSND